MKTPKPAIVKRPVSGAAKTSQLQKKVREGLKAAFPNR